MVRVALYSRVSTKDKGQDCENQLRQLRDFAQRLGWDVTHEYVDRKSGKNSDREQFKAMFTSASRREFDVVLFWSLDRFSREGVLQTLQHLQRLTSYGVGYRSFTEEYLDSCGMFKDAVISILATIAKQERVRLSERVLAGLARARSKGRTGGRPTVVRGDIEAKIVAMRAEGDSLQEIADKLGVSKPTVYRVVGKGNGHSKLKG